MRAVLTPGVHAKDTISFILSALTHISASVQHISRTKSQKCCRLPACLFTQGRLTKELEATLVSSEVRSTAVGAMSHRGMYCRRSAMKTADT